MFAHDQLQQGESADEVFSRLSSEAKQGGSCLIS